MFYDFNLMFAQKTAHRSRKLLLEVELVFERGGDK